MFVHPETLQQIALDVCQSMLGLTLTPADSQRQAVTPQLMARVEIHGEQRLVVEIFAHEQLTAVIAETMFAADRGSLSRDEIRDAFGEVANMIIGNIKTNLEDELGCLALGVPTVTFGKNFSTRSTAKHSWTLVPFTCEGCQLFVQVLLVESSEFSLLRSTTARSLLGAGV